MEAADLRVQTTATVHVQGVITTVHVQEETAAQEEEVIPIRAAITEEALQEVILQEEVLLQ